MGASTGLHVSYTYRTGTSTGLHVSYRHQHWLTRIVRVPVLAYTYRTGATTGSHVSHGREHWPTRIVRITHLESHVGANEDVDEHHETEHAQSRHQKT